MPWVYWAVLEQCSAAVLCRGGIRTMMITGDYHHTAIAVARDVGMFKPGVQVAVVDSNQQLQSEESPVTSSQTAHGGASPACSPHVSFTQPHDKGADSHRKALQGQKQALTQVAGSPLARTGKQVSWVPALGDDNDDNQQKQHTEKQHHSAPDSHGPLMEGFRLSVAGQEHVDAAQVLAALAEGQMQCAVTGDALEALLQHHDMSMLETVMHSVVVFSRMQPHQKGQVMDLLGMTGVHQLFHGQPRHVAV